MSRSIRLSLRAQGDLARLAEFLDDVSPQAARRMVATVKDAIDSLSDHPDRGRPLSGAGLRELAPRFGDSSYVIRYQIRPDRIVVTRIWNSRERRG